MTEREEIAVAAVEHGWRRVQLHRPWAYRPDSAERYEGPDGVLITVDFTVPGAVEAADVWVNRRKVVLLCGDRRARVLALISGCETLAGMVY